ncbi:MAG: DUF4920 domain-containing protein [Aridibacter sp.]
MKKLVFLTFILFTLSFNAFAQEDSPNAKKATDADKVVAFDTDGKIKRGAEIGDSKMVSLDKIFKNPDKYAGKTVRVKGFVVRSCKMEGCWAELGQEKDSKQTVRVKMKDHAFFIPLKSAGYKVLTEGIFSIKTLLKEEVAHLIEEDGAKFEKINKNGTVTEISFLASGIELSKGD